MALGIHTLMQDTNSCGFFMFVDNENHVPTNPVFQVAVSDVRGEGLASFHCANSLHASRIASVYRSAGRIPYSWAVQSQISLMSAIAEG